MQSASDIRPTERFWPEHVLTHNGVHMPPRAAGCVSVQASCIREMYLFVHHSWFLGRPEIMLFAGIPLRPEKHSGVYQVGGYTPVAAERS